MLAVLMFYVLHSWINTNRYYLIFLGVYMCVLYILSRNIYKTVWIALASSFPFQQAKYFTSVFHSFYYPNARIVPVTYFISYSDALILLLLYLFIRRRSKFSLSVDIPSLFLIPLVIVGGIATYMSQYFTIALFGLYQAMKLCIVYVLSRLVLKEKWGTRTTLDVFLLFVLYNAILIILQRIAGGPLGLPVETLNASSLYGRYALELRSLYRPGGFTDDPNASATILGMFIPFLTILGLTRNAFHKTLVWITLICATVALLCTASRSVWIVTTILVGLSVYRIYHLRLIRIPKFLRIHGYWIGILVTLFAAPLIYLRISTLQQAFSDTGSGTFRLIHLRIAVNTMLSYPWGTGLGTTPLELINRFPPAYYMFDPSELHSIFAQIAASLGIPGLLCFVLFIYSLLKRHIQSYQEHKTRVLPYAIFMSMISYLMTANFYPWFLNVQISGFFWILAAYTI